MDCLDQLDVCDGNVVIKKYVEVGEERYSILLFGGENINFLQTHSQTFGPAWNKENTFSADTEPPAGGS